MAVGGLGSEGVEDFGAELGEGWVTDADEVSGAAGDLCEILGGGRVRDGVEVLRADAPEGSGAVVAFWNALVGVVGGLGLEGAEDFRAGLRKGRAGGATEGPLVAGAFCEALGVG